MKFSEKKSAASLLFEYSLFNPYLNDWLIELEAVFML